MSVDAAMVTDRETLVIVERIVEDLLDCLEGWHRLGYDDWLWVTDYWARRVAPLIDVELPRGLRAATDAADVHRALLAFQETVIARLVACPRGGPAGPRSSC